MVGPWISFIPSGVGIDVGDLEFIRDRVRAGEWLEAYGAINAITNTISIVPANGKTLFMYKAKIVQQGVIPQIPSPATGAQAVSRNEVEAAFKIDGTVKDTTYIGTQASSMNNAAASNATAGGASGMAGDGRLDVTGLSLVGNGIKAVTVENTLDNGSADATMSGWIETT